MLDDQHAANLHSDLEALDIVRQHYIFGTPDDEVVPENAPDVATSLDQLRASEYISTKASIVALLRTAASVQAGHAGQDQAAIEASQRFLNDGDAKALAETLVDGEDAQRLIDTITDGVAREQTAEQINDRIAEIAGRRGDQPIAEVMLQAQDECDGRMVDVPDSNGVDQKAAWLYVKLHSITDFSVLAEWVDPRSWPNRARPLFESVHLRPDPKKGAARWTSTIMETTADPRMGKTDRLNTALQASYERLDGVYCALSYSLEHSFDDIKVDRGFLLVRTKPGGGFTVEALKVLRFRDQAGVVDAELLCSNRWSDWVRTAAEEAAIEQGQREEGAKKQMVDPDDLLTEWKDYVTDAADFYGELAAYGWTRMVAGSGDNVADLNGAIDDSRRAWRRLAQDWAKAWQRGTELSHQLADSETADAPAAAATNVDVRVSTDDIPGSIAKPVVSHRLPPEWLKAGISPGTELATSTFVGLAGGTRAKAVKARVGGSIEDPTIDVAIDGPGIGLYVGEVNLPNRSLPPVRAFAYVSGVT